MAPRPSTPSALLAGPFRRADALQAGLTARQLDSRCWTRIFAQVHVHVSIEQTDEVRLAALRLTAPMDAVATGLTAAWLYGVWKPRPGEPVPLHFATPTDRGGFVASGARSSRLVLDDGDVDEFHGFPVTTPERTCFGLMTVGSLTQAVVWADAFLHAQLVCSGALARYADERPRWPGVRKVREAAQLARADAASPMETRLRMVIVLGGLPEPPLLNQPLYGPDGTLLGVPDMRYVVPWFGLEYDGSYHDDPDQHFADVVRENRLLLLGDLPLLRYTAADVFGAPHRIVREVGTMLRRAPGSRLLLPVPRIGTPQ